MVEICGLQQAGASGSPAKVDNWYCCSSGTVGVRPSKGKESAR